MDFFVDDVPVYDSFGAVDVVDVIEPCYGGYDVIETVTPAYGMGLGVGVGIGIAPPVMVSQPAVATTVTTVTGPQYGYNRPVRPVPMMTRNPYGMGVAPMYGPCQQFPARRFY